MKNCPHCGGVIEMAARPRTGNTKPCLNADTSQMSDVEMRAYYKATAPASDAAFFANAIRNCGHRQLILAAETLALQLADGQHKVRADAYARLTRLQDIWRGLAWAGPSLSAIHNAMSVQDEEVAA